MPEPNRPAVPVPGPPPPGAPDETQVVVTESEVLEERADGSIERDAVRVERQRKRPVDPIAIALTTILLLVAAAGAAWWFLAQDDESQAVPSVEGLVVDQAIERLEEEGFEPVVDRRASDDAEAGTVFEQVPAAGEEAEEGSSVQLAVSSGPSEVAVPNAVGLPEADARDRLVDAGFEVSSREVFAEKPAGTIVSQRPIAGAEAAPGSQVELVVSKGTGLVDVPSLVGMTQGEAEAELSSLGLDVNVVEVPSFEEIGTVVAQNPPAGTIRKGESVRINVSRGS